LIPGNLPNPSLEHTVCINEERVQKWKKKKKKAVLFEQIKANLIFPEM